MTDASVAIIGGADGPTAIFLSGGLPISLILLGGAVLLGIVVLVIAVAKR